MEDRLPISGSICWAKSQLAKSGGQLVKKLSLAKRSVEDPVRNLGDEVPLAQEREDARHTLFDRHEIALKCEISVFW